MISLLTNMSPEKPWMLPTYIVNPEQNDATEHSAVQKKGVWKGFDSVDGSTPFFTRYSPPKKVPLSTPVEPRPCERLEVLAHSHYKNIFPFDLNIKEGKKFNQRSDGTFTRPRTPGCPA
jgi:hypothetical protein